MLDVLVTEAGTRIGSVSCALRNVGDATGWHIIGNGGHEASGATGVTVAVTYDRLILQHPIGATKVRSLVVGVDETFAAMGLRAGASVGLTLSHIFLFNGPSDTPLDPRAVVSANGNLWVLGQFKL